MHSNQKLASIASATKSMLDERFAGYALVAFVAGCDHPMTIINTNLEQKTRMALQTMLQEASFALGEPGREGWEGDEE